MGVTGKGATVLVRVVGRM
ncbi:hypothetical protein TIFTF001_048212, partial [Ficus carica]